MAPLNQHEPMPRTIISTLKQAHPLDARKLNQNRNRPYLPASEGQHQGKIIVLSGEQQIYINFFSEVVGK